jgi:Arc/MetJ-type ribon-helix-helix transcriptional regulator
MNERERSGQGEALITVRLPRGMSEKVDAVIASSFSTKSEYIRALIRKDLAEREASMVPRAEEVGA